MALPRHLPRAKKITERIQIEVRDLDELRQALSADAKRILLDNFSPDDLRAAVATIGAIGEQVELEASGGINESNLADFAAAGVNRISIGALTKDIKAADFSFLIESRIKL